MRRESSGVYHKTEVVLRRTARMDELNLTSFFLDMIGSRLKKSKYRLCIRLKKQEFH